MKQLINNRWYLLELADKKNMPIIYDLLDSLKEKKGNVACTDGKVIYIDPTLFNQETTENQFLILCHELLHIIYKHNEMLKNPKFPRTYLLNIAQDIVINEYLKKKLKMEHPNGLYLHNLSSYLKNAGLINPFSDINYQGILTTRSLYEFIDRRIKDDQMEDDMKSNLGTPNDLLEESESLPSESISEEIIQKTCERLKIDQSILSNERCEQALQGIYNQSSGLSKQKIISTKEIIDFVKKFIGNNAVVKGRQQTYKKPSRRYQSSDLVMKGYNHYKNVKEIDIYLDTSGSMDDQFITDMYSALKTLFQTTKFKLFEFKYKVREVNLKNDYISANGGTSISSVLNHIKSNKFDHAILITDCEDRFSLDDLDADLMIFTNNLRFTTNNPKVHLTYFK